MKIKINFTLVILSNTLFIKKILYIFRGGEMLIDEENEQIPDPDCYKILQDNQICLGRYA